MSSHTQVWVDLETTGLSTLDDQILEIGIVVIQDNYIERPGNEFHALFPLTNYATERLDRNDFVREMHTNNGLLQEIESRFGTEIEPIGYQSQCEIEQANAIQWLSDLGLQPAEFAMCGASVHFDRAWLKEDMPLLESWFHYRNFDVSTLKDAVERWYPTFYAEMFPEGHEDPHRAIPDCYEEIGEAARIRMLFDGLERVTNK
jgi:oligoribonuclease